MHNSTLFSDSWQVVEPFTSHYVFALGVARFLSCAHWILQVISTYKLSFPFLYSYSALQIGKDFSFHNLHVSNLILSCNLWLGIRLKLHNGFMWFLVRLEARIVAHINACTNLVSLNSFQIQYRPMYISLLLIFSGKKKSLIGLRESQNVIWQPDLQVAMWNYTHGESVQWRACVQHALEWKDKFYNIVATSCLISWE